MTLRAFEILVPPKEKFNTCETTAESPRTNAQRGKNNKELNSERYSLHRKTRLFIREDCYIDVLISRIALQVQILHTFTFPIFLNRF